MIGLFFRHMVVWTILFSLMVAMGFSVLGLALTSILVNSGWPIFGAFVLLIAWVSFFCVLFDGPPMRFLDEWVDGRRKRLFDARAWEKAKND